MLALGLSSGSSFDGVDADHDGLHRLQVKWLLAPLPPGAFRGVRRLGAVLLVLGSRLNLLGVHSFWRLIVKRAALRVVGRANECSRAPKP